MYLLVLKLAGALRHLHATERLLHFNVCPANVLVTDRLMWKLSGLGFAIHPLESAAAAAGDGNGFHQSDIIEVSAVDGSSIICNVDTLRRPFCIRARVPG